ncbi:hypothetical protein NLG97_g891 [Lecanicillium saksenae]|uniref:Uncharacterized protein n=1 Tax=Lecanicillium saksenae TaxID=468837 RepID=A0ACC1R6K9_9HYPO|nr:hypothetical protein NLG97_g891 [Lecanicillium saksenae]
MAEFVRAQIFGTTFEITSRYSDLQPVGMGAFGLVCSARDQLTNQNVAVKKIMKPFSTPVLAKRTYRELKLLKHLRHENVISLSDIFISPLEDIYFVTELLGTDLHRLLTSRPLEKQFIQYFLYQIMRGLKYVHSAGVVHRDLKPSNILVNENCDLKICDFGLARIQDPQMTGYVSTRYYRAPEIMLTWQKYDVEVDIWSAGCIFAEMLDGKPLFPGKDHVNQFSIITELLGTPPDDVINTIASENTLRFVKSLPKRERQPLRNKFKNADDSAIDLMERMLVFDPKKRITAAEALSHDYLAPYHDPTDEPVAEEKFDWSFNDADLPVDTWKIMMYSEILDYHNVEATASESWWNTAVSTTAASMPLQQLVHPSNAQSILPQEERKKLWAPRSRKGCQTCRTRRVKCDEGQPACKKCVTSRRLCVYVQAQRPRKGETRRRELPVLVSKAALHQKEPPEWNLSQAMLFFATVLVPQFERWQIATTSYQCQFPPKPHISKFLFHTSFMMMVTSHRIKMISAQRGVAVRRGQGFGVEHLWQAFFGYMALALEHLNEHIVARSPARYVLHRTIDLLANELPIMDSLWRSHLKGFFAIVALYGGVDTIIETSPRPPYIAMNYGLVFAVYGNSCSPVHDQVDAIYFWSEEDIQRLYTHTFFAASPCPSAIFLAIHRITRLRILAATEPAATECKTTADAISQTLLEFPIADWTEPYDLPTDPTLRRMLAALFRTATILYALLSLPSHLAQPFARSHADTRTAWLHHRGMLMEMLWQTSERIQASVLTWVFAVLGAAYADGSKEDQMLILDQLRLVLSMEDVMSGPGTLLELLPGYWASGKATALGSRPTSTFHDRSQITTDMYDKFLDEPIPEDLFLIHGPQCRTRRHALSQWRLTESFAEPLPLETGGAVEILHRIKHPFTQETILHREVIVQEDGRIRKSVRIGHSDLAAERRHLHLLATMSVSVPRVHDLYSSAEFEHLVMERVPGQLPASKIPKRRSCNATDLKLARLAEFEAAASRTEIVAFVKAMIVDLDTAANVGFFLPYFEWVAAKRMAHGSPDGSWWRRLEERLAEGKTTAWDKMRQVEALLKALEKHSAWMLEPAQRGRNRVEGWADVCRIVGVDLGEPPVVTYPHALEHPFWLEYRKN